MPVTIQSLNVKGTSVATASYVAWANVFKTTADTFTGTASYATTASYAIFAENGGGGGGLTATQVLGLFIAYPNRMI